MREAKGISPFIEQSIVYISRVLSIIVLIASVQVFIELVLRYFFNSPTSWGLELSTFLCGATYILSGGYASLIDAHIRIDLLYSRLSKRGIALLDLIFTYPLLMATLGLITWKSYSWTVEALSNKITSGTAWDPPLWPMRLTLLFGIFVLLCAEIINIKKRIRDIRSH
jgi:TRAP-type mannitol/chloroaromatic compound transport system permease small subunit